MPADPDVDAFHPNSIDKTKIDKILSELKDFESIQLDLQRCDIALSKVCDNFSEVLEEFLSAEKRL